MPKTMLALSVGSCLVAAGLAMGAPWQVARHAQPAGRPTVVFNPTDSFPFMDNFDSYAPGPFPCATVSPGCTGPNGWALWYAAETGGPQNGTIVASGANSPPNALQMNPISDIVQTGNVTTGQWTIKAKTFFPSAATGTPREQYFIVLNSYTGNMTGPDNWSIQVRLDGDATGAGAGMVLSDVRGTAAHPAPAVHTPQPLVFDQWVEIRAEINLTTDRYNIFYNNQPVLMDCPYSTASTTVGQVRIACLDLYSNGVNGFLWDDVSITQAGAACYPNCDGSTTPPILNVNDFICFQAAFAAGASYANCDNSTTPPVLNVNDFICFQGAFAGGCP